MAREFETEYGKGDQSFLRQHNTKKVLNSIRLYGECSRVELAQIANLDRKTITNITGELLAKKQIVQRSLEHSGYGRPREMLAINKDYCRCIGLDLGSTHITGVILDFSGNTVCASRIELSENLGPDMLTDLCDLVFRQLFAQSHLTMEDIAGIGISFPGQLDPNTGKARLAENMHNWHEVPLKDLFYMRYKKTILAEDCSRLMGLAEMWYGRGKGVDNFVVIDLGLGIGCGIIINGSIFSGSTRVAGEIGHMIVKADGPSCTCGRRGCIEALSSGWALRKQANDLLKKGNQTILRVMGNAKEPTSLHLALAAELGDPECLKVLQDAGKYIGIGVGNAIAMLNPEKVIIGGRLIKNNAILLQAIVESARKMTIEPFYSQDLIVVSELEDASAIGAATMCIQDYFTEPC